MQRERARLACRSSLSAASSGRGFGTCSSTAPPSLATVARRRTPTSTPTREPGSATPGCCGRCTRTRTLDIQPCAVAAHRDRKHPRPPGTDESFDAAVFSCVRTVPITGSVRWRRSGSTRIAPVVKHTRSAIAAFALEAREPDPLPGACTSTGALPVPIRVHRTRGCRRHRPLSSTPATTPYRCRRSRTPRLWRCSSASAAPEATVSLSLSRWRATPRCRLSEPRRSSCMPYAEHRNALPASALDRRSGPA